MTLALVAGETGVFAHPLGQLQVTQKIAPLGWSFRVRQQEVMGQQVRYDRGEGRRATVASPPPATEYFARSQFVDMSDEQKLSVAVL